MSLAFIDALDDAVGCNLSHDLLYMLEEMMMLLGRKIKLTAKVTATATQRSSNSSHKTITGS